ncbi:D-cysteine desulfhydrase family protein [Candidatus Neomicrothrix sp.]|jgi:D-cysteine desulfhydrase family pyridoxal phosphate-dependent enzyme|uniref:D-cysteine desulfhydrase family protein n=1 Tax=Candidatus Neomicrothrix sp. TaxID=2719034 RepID=UPI001B664453|nr:D-cysteine desulfhydrase family protein [Candidatus Microthrix sp.]MBK6501943.1 D-cysteine desulfhydrase family protein [Candidatus Microthrix sp.]MBK7018389.1 D-cysteine desulfhydrase family protein [Candidatus Microthrix sp.]MBK7322137.1 D-cysteine desulfhydrase family protein [Candidatus Microthrix sp.]MBP6135008.1 D-cysteine desulfhydrase family protein [Candidatus Microthrix sp.]MBP6150595.1 D-cysteine desulfhydrase family protein [Candidatus Microthrix sp.]
MAQDPAQTDPARTDPAQTDNEPPTAAQVIADTQALLDPYPRRHLATLPTPLQPCERLSEALGGPEIWVKRDDCTGLALGGNKVRKLEYLMGQAIAEGASRVGTFGALQSNHARQTAAAANALGLGCELVLTEMVPRDDHDYVDNGNQTLFRILGVPTHRVTDDVSSAAAISAVEEAAAEAGEIVSWIPTGGSSPVGALGYVNAAIELVHQAVEAEVGFHRIVLATSTGGTYAGLLAGMDALGAGTAVTGFDTYEGAARSRAAARTLLDALGPMLGRNPVAEGSVDILDGYCGDGYGIPTREATEAIELFARTEGLLLDPVYSGKAAAGLIDVVRRGLIGDDERVVFLHTGGAPGLFAYSGEFR